MTPARFLKLNLPALALAALCGCGPKFLAREYRAPARVAVLPFANYTNDVQGPDILRKLLIELLPKRGYVLMGREDVDKILLERFGISEGGQLALVTPQDLGKALNADGLIYGNLLRFIDLPLGYARRKTVKANLKLYDSLSGMLLWEDEKSWTTPELHLSSEDAKRALAVQVADRQLRKMNGTFLREESVLMLELALRNLPQANILNGAQK